MAAAGAKQAAGWVLDAGLVREALAAAKQWAGETAVGAGSGWTLAAVAAELVTVAAAAGQEAAAMAAAAGRP